MGFSKMCWWYEFMYWRVVCEDLWNKLLRILFRLKKKNVSRNKYFVGFLNWRFIFYNLLSNIMIF